MGGDGGQAGGLPGPQNKVERSSIGMRNGIWVGIWLGAIKSADTACLARLGLWPAPGSRRWVQRERVLKR